MILVKSHASRVKFQIFVAQAQARICYGAHSAPGSFARCKILRELLQRDGIALRLHDRRIIVADTRLMVYRHPDKSIDRDQ